MSDSQAYEEVTVVSDGITVVKRFEEDDFPVPAIAFEFTSDRDEEVHVRLSDAVPETVEVEDLGFHPEYGSEYWTIDEERITFERDLGANSACTSVYGIRATGTDDVEQFLAEPVLETVDPPLPEEEKEDAADGDVGEDAEEVVPESEDAKEVVPESEDAEEVVPESEDAVVRDVISGEADNINGLEAEDEAAVTDEEIETLELKDPNSEDGGTASSSADGSSAAETEANEAEETTADVSGGESGTQTVDAAEVSLDGTNLVSSLAAEIRQNKVSKEDVKLLREAFEIAGQQGGSIQARLERIQRDVGNLRAYTDSLEDFLDENGTGQEIIERFEQDLESVQTDLESMESKVTANSETVSGMERQVASLEDNVSEVSEEVSVVSDEVEDVSSEVEEVSEEVEEVSEEVEEVSEEVEGVSTEVGDVSEDVDSMKANFHEIQAAIEDLEDELETIESEVTEGDVAARIDDIEEDIGDLKEWQNQIRKTFGG